MKEELLKTPSIALWKSELNKILSNQRNVEIRKLGTIGSYIENIFIYSNDKIYSISCFEEAFNELIVLEIRQEEISKQNLELIISIINTFKGDYDFSTATTQYLTYSIGLIQKTVKYNSNIFEYENIFFTYCLYINFLKQNDKLNFNTSSTIKRETINTLNNIIGLSDRISSLAIFIILSMDEESPIFFDNLSEEVSLRILRYSLSNKFIKSKCINEFVVNFAIANRSVFETELLRFGCKLNMDCNALVYKVDLSQRDLEPNYLEWERLHDIYYDNTSTYNQILQNSLNRQLA